MKAVKSGNVFEVVESRFGDRFDVSLEGEGCVQDDSQVAHFSGRRDGAAVKSCTLGATIMSSVILLFSSSRFDDIQFFMSCRQLTRD